MEKEEMEGVFDVTYFLVVFRGDVRQGTDDLLAAAAAAAAACNLWLPSYSALDLVCGFASVIRRGLEREVLRLCRCCFMAVGYDSLMCFSPHPISSPLTLTDAGYWGSKWKCDEALLFLCHCSTADYFSCIRNSSFSHTDCLYSISLTHRQIFVFPHTHYLCISQHGLLHYLCISHHGLTDL